MKGNNLATKKLEIKTYIILPCIKSWLIFIHYSSVSPYADKNLKYFYWFVIIIIFFLSGFSFSDTDNHKKQMQKQNKKINLKMLLHHNRLIYLLLFYHRFIPLTHSNLIGLMNWCHIKHLILCFYFLGLGIVTKFCS